MSLSLEFRELRKAFITMTKRPSLIFSFSFYKMLTLILFTETLLFPPSSFPEASAGLPQALFFAICALVCLGAALFLRKSTNLFAQNWYIGLILFCMLIGLFLLFLRVNAHIQDYSSRNACFFLGLIFTGLGFIGIHIEFGRLLGHLGTTQTLIFGIIGSCIGATFYLFFCFLPISSRWIFLFTGVILMVFFFYRARRTCNTKELYNHKREARLQIPYKFMATSFIQGISFGFLYGIVIFSEMSFRPSLEITSFFGAALLTCITLFILQIDFNRAIYQIGFPLMAIGLLLSGLFMDTPQGGTFLQTIGFLYLDLILWALGSYLIKECNQPATWVAACPSAFLMTGRALGIAGGTIVIPQEESASLCIAAFLVICSALFLSSTKNIKTGWGFIRPGSPESEEGLLKACVSLSQDFELTPRESDMLYALSSPRSIEEIAESLFISQNTAKSHTQNIYRKLGIHSRKELHRIISRRQKLFSPSQEIE